MYNSNNGNVGVAPTCNSAYEPNCVKEPRPKGRFVSVRTETAGGPVVENFRLCEVMM